MKKESQLEANLVWEQMKEECLAMAEYALSNGFRIPDQVALCLMVQLEEDREFTSGDPSIIPSSEHSPAPDATEIEKLNHAHQVLSGIVAPATPGSILLLAHEARKASLWGFLGKLPLIRRMMGAALLFLVMFVAISLSPDITINSGGILDSEGIPLLLNLAFLVCSAGLGACFAALFQANRYIVKGTFDPKHEPSYWIRSFLGIIAGLLLAELVPLDFGEGTQSLGKPTLAMLGGFSASLVYRVLNRLVETVESLVRGSTDDLIANRERSAQMKAEEQASATRLKVARDLVQLEKLMTDKAPKEAIEEHLKKITDDLMPTDRNTKV